MNIKNLFRRLFSLPTGEGRGGASPLRIEGVEPAPMTPEPDDAEMAAQALLESMITPTSPLPSVANGDSLPLVGSQPHSVAPLKTPVARGEGLSSPSGKLEGGFSGNMRDLAYYRRLAERIRQGHEMEARLTKRYVAYCEDELRNHADDRHWEEGQIAALNRGLMERMDIVEREGGELKKRWQHCLAEVTVKLLNVSS